MSTRLSGGHAKSGRRRGFTLVELLVVIAIIVVLIMLFVPGMQSALYRARQIKCMANLSQMGKALVMYVTEHDNFPGHHWDVIVWPHRLRHYMNYDHSLFYCPENMYWGVWQDLASQQDSNINPSEDIDRQRARWAQWKVTWKSTRAHANKTYASFGYLDSERLWGAGGGVFSYGYNDWGSVGDVGYKPHQGLGGHVLDPTCMPKSFRSIVSPSSMFAIADSRTDGAWDTAMDPTSSSGAHNDESPSQRHFGGANMLCADGHVEFLKYQQMVPIRYNNIDVETKKDIMRRWNASFEPFQNQW